MDCAPDNDGSFEGFTDIIEAPTLPNCMFSPSQVALRRDVEKYRLHEVKGFHMLLHKFDSMPDNARELFLNVLLAQIQQAKKDTLSGAKKKAALSRADASQLTRSATSS